MVDVGAGLGYFTVPCAAIVGESGFVYSIEPDSKRSDKIRARVVREGLDNVRVITTKAENLADIPTADTDLAFSAFSAHHFEDKEAAVTEIRRVLRDGGAFYLWDSVPGRIFKHGTRPEEVGLLAQGFARFEPSEIRKTIRVRFVK